MKKLKNALKAIGYVTIIGVMCFIAAMLIPLAFVAIAMLLIYGTYSFLNELDTTEKTNDNQTNNDTDNTVTDINRGRDNKA